MLTNQIKGGIILAAVSICKNLLDIFLFKDKILGKSNVNVC